MPWSYAVEAANPGARMIIDMKNGKIKIQDQIFTFSPLPDEVMDMFAAGGLVPFTRMQIEAISK